MSISPLPHAVLTGAGSGLGRALSLELARRQAKLLLSDIDVKSAEETAHLATQLGAKAIVHACDVSKAEQVEALAAFADRELGPVDLLVNNAGVAVSGAIGDVPLKEWEWIFAINLWGVIYGCHTFVPRFRRHRRGHILNVASAAGLLSAPDMGPYNVSKAGVVSLSETLYSELRPFGVGVTVLCPTFFQTSILEKSHTFLADKQMQSLAANLMRKSKVQAPDVARLALEACANDELYCVPMLDGQWSWRMKRLSPEVYFRTLLPKVFGAMRKRAAK